jgi:hypothetical protein
MRLSSWLAEHVTETATRKYVLVAHITGAILSLCLFGPLFFMALDREPPFKRLEGSLVPDRVDRGGSAVVRYVTTKRFRSDCPGQVQQEIVDSQNTIFSKLARETGPSRWEEFPGDPRKEIFYGRPVAIPEQAAPGRALFRTVTFRYCNFVQRLLHWPIVQIGPDLHFTINEEVVDDRRMKR